METASATADSVKLKEILSERGLPSKIDAKLNFTEQKIHTVLCSEYNFTTGVVSLEIPAPVYGKCTDELKKIWHLHPKPIQKNGKITVLFTLTQTAVKRTVRTAMLKDQGIFESKINVVPLHFSWARHINPTPENKPTKNVDWSKAEKYAEKVNEHVKQNINDGKTFNAQKDNPWARKNLRKKPE